VPNVGYPDATLSVTRGLRRKSEPVPGNHRAIGPEFAVEFIGE
jgi:hypothetical protein